MATRAKRSEGGNGGNGPGKGNGGTRGDTAAGRAQGGEPIVFSVPGQLDTVAATTRGQPGAGTVKASVQVGTLRAAGQPVSVSAQPGEDVVVLEIVDGPTLVLHPADARDLMRAQQGAATRSASAAAPNEVAVPAQLAWPGVEAGATRDATRGWLGQAVLGAFKVLTGPLEDRAASFAASVITKKVDGKVEAGVYQLEVAALDAPLKGSGKLLKNVPAATEPMLVLIHGTFVDTVSTFGKLWAQHATTVQSLFEQYGGRVYALDHPTMGASPIANALTLVAALPAGARLHLLTHSRGGLVAEVLARACSGETLSHDELALFEGDSYQAHRDDLTKLYTAAKAKQIAVERVVRVACPARGTLLASKRFDAYLSVLQWALKLAGVPVAPELVDFLHEVARRRADPAQLPGIESMMPESPVVAWLNHGDRQIPGELRVIAGDMQGDSIGSWVKTLLTDAFYWTDNDIVVQTRSMYGGAPREESAATATSAAAAGASFLLDRGAQVTHFNYFANVLTVDAIRSALQGAAPSGFQAIGPLSWAGQDASGVRAGPPLPQPTRPAVFVLPGILGSNLAVDGRRIWLGFHFLNGLKKLAWDPDSADHVTPDGPIGSSYDELIAHLATTHEVIPFAYDWRRPLEDEARRLADAVEDALDARITSGEPVRLLAHSMGGLLARTMHLERPLTWERMMAVGGARLLMLGTPNGGSWSPMQTLSGDDTFGNALVAFGSIFDNGGARKMMAGMPGFIQLQAGLTDPVQRLDSAETWAKLAADDLAVLKARSIWHDEGAQRTIYEWGAPPQPVLDQAVALRRRLDAQIPALAADAAKMLLVIGHADRTPVGIVESNDGLEYLQSSEGDGRVPLGSATQLELRTWRVDAEHGKLPDVRGAFDAYTELLTTGQTRALPVFDPAAVGTRAGDGSVITAPMLTRGRPSRGFQSSEPPADGADVLGNAGGVGPVAARPRTPAGAVGPIVPLNLLVLNGDLKFVPEPLMIGHYRALKLTGTEAVVDALVGQAMTSSLDAGVYPDPPGDHKIFGNVRDDPESFDMARPKAVIVVGLGEEGKLKSVDLVRTVRQAIVAYAQRVKEVETGQRSFELAATLIGSGGTGISAGSAAQLIAQGASEALQKLVAVDLPLLARLTLVELYLERASDAWRALQLQAESSKEHYNLIGKVRFGTGSMRRSLDTSYRGANYDFISARSVKITPAETNPGQPRPMTPPLPQTSILYTLDTRRARTEVRGQKPQGALLKELVKNASNDANRDRQIGRTLFNLLVPVEIEPFLGGSAEMLIELDAGTAVIPWELLETDAGISGASAQKPWAIRSKLLRKLQVENYRLVPNDASADDSVLVIGEPKTSYGDLPAARAEAQAVVDMLTRPANGIAPERVRSLLDKADARTVINALFERSYRIVHIAGHGAPGPTGGVVLSGENMFLGAAEVESMRVVPELVFLNCCHLAGRDASSTLEAYDRAEFAANIAEALIKVGVRCVIAAGWAVEDRPAEKFATTFYEALLNGRRFIEAVATAREAAWKLSKTGNTWAAYQCYGDPEWTWRRQVGDAQQPATPRTAQYADIASPVGLVLALENLAVGAKYSAEKAARAPAELEYLETRFGALWCSMGAVAEAFGLAFVEVRNTEKAIEWYRRAVDAADGSASFKAAEQLGNQLVRRGEKLGDPLNKAYDLGAARAFIDEGVRLLARVAGVQPTVERESLLGSAYKRLVMVEDRAKRPAAALRALHDSATHYASAVVRARDTGADNLYYPGKNCLSLALRLAFVQNQPVQFTPGLVREVQDSLEQAAAREPSFWSVVGKTEILVLDALSRGALAADLPKLAASFRQFKQRVPAPGNWDSVYNEAQFTLEPYQAVSIGDEARAAAELLALLKSFTSAVAPAAAAAATPATPARPARPARSREAGAAVIELRALRGGPAVESVTGAGDGPGDGADDTTAALLKDPRNVPLWFATNREPVSRAQISRGFTGMRSTGNTVQRGLCIVNVPVGHELGSTGSSGLAGWFKRLRRGDDRLQLISIKALDEAGFWAAVQAAMAEADVAASDALMFVHGFNVSFNDAALRAAQLAYDLKIRDTSFFSWPSAGSASPLSYTKDEDAAKNAVGALAEFVLAMDRSAQAAGKALHLIAHSMGNRVLLGALRRLVARGHVLQAIDKIVCAAPDEDAVEFTEAMQELLGVGKRRTLYASSHDKPLLAASVIHGNARAGRMPPVTWLAGLDTIDASGLDLTFMAHSDFAENRPLLNDLYGLLKEGSAPAERIGLEPATGDGDATYWRIR